MSIIYHFYKTVYLLKIQYIIVTVVRYCILSSEKSYLCIIFINSSLFKYHFQWIAVKLYRRFNTIVSTNENVRLNPAFDVVWNDGKSWVGNVHTRWVMLSCWSQCLLPIVFVRHTHTRNTLRSIDIRISCWKLEIPVEVLEIEDLS